MYFGIEIDDIVLNKIIKTCITCYISTTKMTEKGALCWVDIALQTFPFTDWFYFFWNSFLEHLLQA